MVEVYMSSACLLITPCTPELRIALATALVIVDHIDQ